MRRGVGFAAAALAAASLASGCGGGGTPNEGTSGTARAVLSRPGPDIALIQGTSDYAVGDVRVLFLVIDSQGRSIERPRARKWLSECEVGLMQFLAKARKRKTPAAA